MSNSKNKGPANEEVDLLSSRRSFLQYSASATAAGLVFPTLLSCRQHMGPADTPSPQPLDSPRIVNIINFVRQIEPRIEWITEDVLYQTVVEQIELMKRYGLRGTFLLQYDALVDLRYQRLFKEQPAGMFEIGAWWELPQQLVEDAGYGWRGRYPWDWHADVGFSTGYSPEERIQLVDTYMAKFKQIFGSLPKSAGSWFIDAVTLNYMAERYGITASCNCKDQIGTDGYTLWGGYWNQAYYPSKKNAYMPAQHAESQISVPIFRMLGSDPIHQYDSGLGSDHQKVISLEPVYTKSGGDPNWIDWYLEAFINGPAMAYGYVQAGQENSFTWSRMKRGLEYQFPKIAELEKRNKLSVQTLEESGEWFRKQFAITPATSVSALEDYSDKKLKTVWFNSRYYRANLLWEDGTLRFRDIHCFNEDVASDYLMRRGLTSQCFFHTLPVVDGWNWSTAETIAGLHFLTKNGDPIIGEDLSVRDSTAELLSVTWRVKEANSIFKLSLNERSMSIKVTGDLKNDWTLALKSDKKKTLPYKAISDHQLTCLYRGHDYVIKTKRGRFSNEGHFALFIIPEFGQIALDLSTVGS